MRDKNTMGLPGYLCANLYWGLLGMYFFRATVFRIVGELTLTQSKWLLWALLAVFLLMGIALTYKRRRNYLSIWANIVLPFELYTLMAYGTQLPYLATVSIALAAGLSVGYIFLVATAAVPRVHTHTQAFAKKLRTCLLGVKTIFSCCLFLLILTLISSAVFDISLVRSSTAEKKQDSTWTIAANIDTVCQFSDTKWYSLSDEEKVAAMQVIANIEARYLGLPHGLELVVSTLPDNTVATYDDSKHLIQVNLLHFNESTPTKLLDAICHEAYHAYQRRLCDVYDSVDARYQTLLTFNEAAVYKQEFADYNGGAEDFDEYYTQHCERSARSYAAGATEDYLGRINEYLGIRPTEPLPTG